MDDKLKFTDRIIASADPSTANLMRDHNSAVNRMRQEQKDLEVDIEEILLLGEAGLINEMIVELYTVAGHKVKSRLLEKEMATSMTFIWANMREAATQQLERSRAEWTEAFERQTQQLESMGVPLKWLNKGPDDRRLAIQSKILIEDSLKPVKAKVSEATDLVRSVSEKETDAELHARGIEYEVTAMVRRIAGLSEKDKLPSLSVLT